MKRQGFFKVHDTRTGRRRCRFCNTPGLRWVQHNAQWRLVDAEGRLHACTEYLESDTRKGRRQRFEEHEDDL